MLVDKRRCWAPTPASQLVEACVVGDSIRPSGELGLSVELLDALGDCDERFLRGIEGIGVVAREPPTDRVDPVIVATKERI